MGDRWHLLSHKLALCVAACTAALIAAYVSVSSQPEPPPEVIHSPGPVAFRPLSAVAFGDALRPGPYTFDVSDSGEATWQMPLWIPEGRDGVAPQLSITYGSRRGLGLLGKGFTLSGLSIIARCWRTPASDGQYTQYGATSAGIPVGVPDVLCLDGERLVPLGSSSLELQPENDPSTKVRVTAGTLEDPVSFDVFRSDGKIWRYGSRDDESDRSSHATLKGSAIAITAVSQDPSNGIPNSDRVSESLDGSRSIAWYVDEVLDRWGNFMEIDYDRTTDSGLPGAVEVVPLWIRWTGHHGAPVLYPSRVIEFRYQTVDPRTLYRGGLAARSSRVVSHIVISGPNRLISDGGASNVPPNAFRQYDFQYTLDPTSLTPVRLKSITEGVVNHDGSVTPKDPISFTWSDHPPPSFQSPNELSDVIEFPLPSNPFQENPTDAQAEVLEADVWYSVVGDFDGDGRDDLLYRLPRFVTDRVPARIGDTVIGDWYIRLGSPSGLGPRQTVTGIPPSPGGAWVFSARAIDVDSDGQAELLAYHEPTNVQFYNKSGFALYHFAGCNLDTCSFTTQDIGEEAVTAMPTGYARRGAGLDVGDINGDGFLDIVQNPLICQNPNPSYCPTPLPVVDFENLIVRLSTVSSQPSQFGNPMFATNNGVNLQIDTSEQRHIVDIDGNGVPETLTATYNHVPANGPPNYKAAFLSSVSFSSGGQTVATPLLLHSRPLEQSDIVQPAPSCRPVCQGQNQCSTGAGQIYLTPFTRYFVDLNGDGLPDSVAVPSDNADSCPVPTSHGSELYIAMNAGGVFRAPTRVQQTTHDGFNTSLNRDDYRDPIGPPNVNLAPKSIPGRAVDPGARFFDLDGDGRTDIIHLSQHMSEPADNARGDISQRTSVVWIRSVEGGFQSYDLTAGPQNVPIPAAPQRYIRSIYCDPSTANACKPRIAGGYGARLSQIGDFNGDGAPDIVTLVQNPVFDVDPWARLQQFLGQPISPDVVTGIDGGPLMPAIRVNYRFAGPQSTDGFYAVSARFDAHDNPIVCNPSPCDFGQTYLRKLGWVVHDYSIEAGQFTDQPIHNVYVFSYDTGRFDLRGRGFLGVDRRERILTNDGLSHRFERQILTFDHSTRSRVFHPGTTRYQYTADAAAQRELVFTPIGSGSASVLDVRRSTTWAPRVGGFGFNRAYVKTVEERCEILGNTDPFIPHICGGAATMISSTYVQQSYDSYGSTIEKRTQVAIGNGSWLDQNGALRIGSTPPSLVTVQQLAGINAPDETQWLIRRYPAWVHQSFDPTQQIGEQALKQDVSIAYFPNDAKIKDVTIEPVSPEGPETDIVSGFTFTTSYERDPQLGVLVAISDCAATAPCDPSSSRRGSIAFDVNDTDRIFPSTFTNALGHVTKVWRHATLGVPYALDDENGVRTSFSFDALGRQRYLYRPGGEQESFTYSDDVTNGNRSRLWTLMHSGSAIPKTRKTYDPRLLLAREIQQGFDHDVTRAFTYDRFGRLTDETLPYSGGSSAPPTVQYIRDGIGRVTQISRPGESATAPRFFTFNTYTGRIATQTSECAGTPPNCTGGRGATSKIERDPKGRPVVISTVNANGRALSTQISYWHLDLPSQITRPTLPASQAMSPQPVHPDITFEYDVLGRRKAMTDPDTGTLTYVYNSFGELKRIMDGNGAVTQFEHDVLGRIRHIHTDATSDYPARAGGTGAAQDTTLTYDTGSHAVGRLSTITSVEGISNSYVYDHFGRLHQEQLTDETNSTWLVTYEYDELGRLGAVEYPASGSLPFRVQYDYADNGKIKSVWSTSGTSRFLLWLQLTRNDADQSTLERFGQTETVTRTFDDSFNLREISGVFSADESSAGIPFQRLHFDWGPDRLMTNRFDLDFHLRENYQHDFLGRLVNWEVTQECMRTLAGNQVQIWRICTNTEWQYDYDDWGNMRNRSVVSGTSFPSTTYNYTTAADSSRPHAVKEAITEKQVDAFSYDDAGQMTSGMSNSYHWTPFGLPFRIESASAHRWSTYLYDGFSQRAVEKQGMLGYDNVDERIVSFDGLFKHRTSTRTGDTSDEYIYNIFGNDGVVAQVRRIAQPPVISGGPSFLVENVHFVHPDHLGNPDAVTTFVNNPTIPGGDPTYTGRLVERGKYDPFGERRAPDTLAQPIPQQHAADASIGFTGHGPDDTFGLVDMGGRLYAPSVSHFVSADPIIAPQFPESLNRFSYAFNSPIVRTDPTGLQAQGDDDLTRTATYDPVEITINLPTRNATYDPVEITINLRASPSAATEFGPNVPASTSDETAADIPLTPTTAPTTPPKSIPVCIEACPTPNPNMTLGEALKLNLVPYAAPEPEPDPEQIQDFVIGYQPALEKQKNALELLQFKQVVVGGTVGSTGRGLAARGVTRLIGRSAQSVFGRTTFRGLAQNSGSGGAYGRRDTRRF